MRVRAACVVVPSFHTLRTEDSVKITTAVWTRTSPILNNREHVLLDFAVRIADGRVVEGTKDIVKYLILGYIWMIEGVDDTRCDVLENTSSNFTRGLVQDIAEVVLR